MTYRVGPHTHIFPKGDDQEYRPFGRRWRRRQVTDAVQRLVGRPPLTLDELLAHSAATPAG